MVQNKNQEHEKENVEKPADSRPCSPVAVMQQAGALRKSSDKRAAEHTSKEKRAVFTLFKKLEALGTTTGKHLRSLETTSARRVRTKRWR